MQVQAAPARQGPCGECIIVAEADHRIANHLAILSGLVRQKLSSAGEGSAADAWLALNAVRLQMDAVANLHRALTNHAFAAVELDNQLRLVVSSFSELFEAQVSILQDFATGAELEPRHLLPLTQIVSEILTNAVKHAGGPGRCGRIIARSRMAPDGAAVIEIADDGRGLAGDFDPTRDGGLGFRVIRSSAKALDAAIEFHSSERGLCFRLILPQAARSQSRTDWRASS